MTNTRARITAADLPAPRVTPTPQPTSSDACAPWFVAESQMTGRGIVAFHLEWRHGGKRKPAKVRAPKGTRASRAVRPLVWFVREYDNCGPWFQIDQAHF